MRKRIGHLQTSDGIRRYGPSVFSSGGNPMYEDDKLWPIKCPACLEEFTKKVGWLKTHRTVKCPANGCSNTIIVGKEAFGHALTQARSVQGNDAPQQKFVIPRISLSVAINYLPGHQFQKITATKIQVTCS
jgi:hypothetical protein